MDTKVGKRTGMNWEMGIGIHTHTHTHTHTYYYGLSWWLRQ